MEGIQELLAQLSELDIRVWLEEGKLRLDMPKGLAVAHVVDTLRQRKQEIIDFLTRPAARQVHDDFDPADPAFVADPYPAYRRLREERPVHKSPLGHWVLTRFEDIRVALLNPALANTPAPYSWLHESKRATSLGADVANNILPFQDGEVHAKARRLIASTFSAQLREHLPPLEAMAQQVLDPLLARQSFDVVNDFGRPFATLAIAALLGLPTSEQQKIAQWGDDFLLLLSGVQDEAQKQLLEGSLREFRPWCLEIVQQRKAEPRQDLISAWLAAGRDGGLTDLQIADTAMLLVADGVENVASLVGSSVAILMQHPDVVARMQSDPAFLEDVVQECVRFESPGQYIARVAQQDVVIGGQQIRRHESVLLVLGAANRDPAVYPEADRFRPELSRARHLSFGRGRHTCLGAQLVPLELQAALRVLLPHWNKLHLPECAHAWRTRPGHRWLSACPMSIASA
jgi:pimeloyl-[acyl-carrier protein] synthase